MNILVLGGTGAMGTHLVEILAQNGMNVTVTSRRRRQNSKNVTYIEGNAHNQHFLNEVLKSNVWDAIVDFMAYSTVEYKERIHVLLNSTRQLVYLSSARVYAQSSSPLTEQSPRLLDICKDEDYLSTDEYALAKARQENLLFDCGKNNWTIIRPYVTYDENRLQLCCEEKESWLYRAMYGRTIVVSEDMLNRTTTFTYGGDVARGIAAVIGQEDALGEAFHITNNDYSTWKVVLEWYLNTIENFIGKRPDVLVAPEYKVYYGGTPRQVQYDRLYDRTFDNSKISHYCDVNSFIKTKDGIELCLNKFLTNPRWNSINIIHEALKDRDTKEWMRIDEFSHIGGLRDTLRYYAYRAGFKCV